MDLFILILLIVIVFLVLRRLDSFVYFLGVVDILLRLITFLKLNINLPAIHKFLDLYVPESIPAIISKYSTGVFYTIIIWVYVICIVLFEYYLIKTLIKKR